MFWGLNFETISFWNIFHAQWLCKQPNTSTAKPPFEPVEEPALDSEDHLAAWLAPTAWRYAAHTHLWLGSRKNFGSYDQKIEHFDVLKYAMPCLLSNFGSWLWGIFPDYMHIVHLALATDSISSVLLDLTDPGIIDGGTRDARLNHLWLNYRDWCESSRHLI